jgi:KipI family sensor histidine kinase inhibitor
LLPLGDRALLIRFSTELSDAANRAAVGLARRLEAERVDGVAEIAPGLVSVLLRLEPGADFARLAGEIRLRLGVGQEAPTGAERSIAVSFDGEDLAEVAEKLGISPPDFVARHNARPLRVLATGFAPGFVYLGFHADDMIVPRREAVRPVVPAGTVLFAAGQTAIAATPIRTGWHVIGRTTFQNFDPTTDPPTVLAAGDLIRFEAVA